MTNLRSNSKGISSVELTLLLLVLLVGGLVLFKLINKNFFSAESEGLDRKFAKSSFAAESDLINKKTEGAKSKKKNRFTTASMSSSNVLSVATSSDLDHAASRKIMGVMQDYLEYKKMDWETLNALLSEVKAEDYSSIWQMLNALPWSAKKEEAMKNFFESWSAKDPQAAIEFASNIQSRRERKDRLNTIVETWAQSDPKGAFEWFASDGMDYLGVASSSLPGLFKAMRTLDSEWALDQVWTLTDPLAQRRLLFTLLLDENAGLDPAQGRTQLLKMMDDVEDPQQRAMLVNLLASNMAREDPWDTTQWIEGLNEEEQMPAVMGLLKWWSRVSPEEATQWASGFEDPRLLNRASQQLVKEWNSDNKEEFRTWLENTADSPLRDAMVSSFTGKYMKNNYSDALDLAATVSEVDLREQLMRKVLSSWMKKDQKTATIAALESEVSDNFKRSIVRKVSPNIRKSPKRKSAKKERVETP